MAKSLALLILLTVFAGSCTGMTAASIIFGQADEFTSLLGLMLGGTVGLVLSPIIAGSLWQKHVGKVIGIVFLPTWIVTMLIAAWGGLPGAILTATLMLLVTCAIASDVLKNVITKHPTGHCQKCGYDLRGSPTGVCSECGRNSNSNGKT